MTLAQATLALGTSSPLIRLGVYRPSVEDSTFVQLLADNHMLIEFLRPVYVFYTCVPTMYIIGERTDISIPNQAVTYTYSYT